MDDDTWYFGRHLEKKNVSYITVHADADLMSWKQPEKPGNKQGVICHEFLKSQKPKMLVCGIF